ncbi:MAG: hypothetical protein AAF928_02255 [Myxococcota bacterium]
MAVTVEDASEELARHMTASHDEAGVDLSQIDAMLALSPRERLRCLFETARSLARLVPTDDADPLV